MRAAYFAIGTVSDIYDGYSLSYHGHDVDFIPANKSKKAQHLLRDNTVESEAIVVAVLGQIDEVGCSQRHRVKEQLHLPARASNK